jgi:hypothetical protein
VADTSEKRLAGRRMISVRRERIGKIRELIVHGDGEDPNWACVRMGLLGRRTALVPLYDAEDDGGKVRVVYEREHIQGAPRVEPQGGRISDEEAELLHRHYGLARVTTAHRDDEELDLPRETREAKPPAMEEGPDSPLTKRRRERAKELGVPGTQ